MKLKLLQSQSHTSFPTCTIGGLKVVQARSRVHDRLARHIQSKEHRGLNSVYYHSIYEAYLSKYPCRYNAINEAMKEQHDRTNVLLMPQGGAGGV